MRETHQRLPLGRFPVTSGLLALLIGVFAVEELRGGSTDTLVLLQLGANFPPLVLEGQWYRLVTAALLHVGFVHLAMNGWALWQLGRLCEITFGGLATLALFVFTGVTGSLLTLLATKVSAGASGAIFGLEGALLAFFLRHRDRLTPAGVHLLKQLLVWSAIMLAYGFLVPGIDWLGHLGGLCGGLAVGWAIPPWRGGPAGLVARGSALLAAMAIVASLAAVVAGERFVEKSAPAVGLALDAPANWRIDPRAEEGLVVTDPLEPLGTLAYVVAAPDPAASEEEALRDLEADLVRDGAEIAAEARRVEEGWLRRTFVRKVGREELAGFVQARCDPAGCLVTVAAVRGNLYGEYLPLLERIAGSVRRIPST